MRRAPLDAPEAARPLLMHRFERALEAGEPLDHRGPGGDLLVGLHEEAEGVLHLLKSLGRLHESAQAELAPEYGGWCQNGRYDPRSEPVGGGEVGHPLLPQHDAPPVLYHRLEPLAKAAELVGLAAVERHALGVLAKAHEAESEVGLVSLPIEVQLDQRAAEPAGHPR